jgi:mRNA export factor
MDAKRGVLVAGTADKQMHVFDLSKGLQKIAEYKSPLSYQTRSVSIFADGAGYVMGCIEGRAAVEYFSEMSKKSAPKQKNDPNFIFKCHRDKKSDKDPSVTIYSVNAIAFHPLNTFCTAGSDGILCYWDKDAKTRLHSLERFKNVNSISALAFNPMGSLLVYAISYDWSRGAEGNNTSLGNQLFIHPVQETEVKPKDKPKIR